MRLGLDTTSSWLHLALVGPEGVHTHREALLKGQGTSEVLVPALDALLARAGATAADLTGVAACVGPGDANCDGIVNGADIGIVIGGWSIPPC